MPCSAYKDFYTLVVVDASLSNYRTIENTSDADDSPKLLNSGYQQKYVRDSRHMLLVLTHTLASRLLCVPSATEMYEA